MQQDRTSYFHAYNTRPDIKAHKKDYDRVYHAKTTYKEYWEIMLMVMDIEKIVRKRVPSKYERLKMRGVHTRASARYRLKKRSS